MLTGPELERLRVIIARASSPGERASGELFTTAADAGTAAEARSRRSEWRESACGGDRQRFELLLAARGIAPQEVTRRLARVVLRTPERLPGWGATLIDLVAALPATGNRVADSTPSFGWAFAPLADLAGAEIDRLPTAPALAAGARRDLIEHLGRRLVEHLGPTLAHCPGIEEALDGFVLPERRTVYETFFPYRPSPPGSAAAGWIDLLDLYPVAGRLLATVYGQWRAQVARLLERVARDRPLLEDRLAPAGSLGALESVAAGAGDVHDGGATVSILGFSSGTRVVYKPRDLRVAARFQELLGLLNAAGLSLPLHRRAVIVGDGYAWEEFVERADCVSGEQVAGYFRRLGMLLALLQWLEGRDFIGENLLACGEHPVLIDLEGLLQPRLPPAASTRSEAEAAAERRLEESPAHIGILPVTLIGEPGRRGIDPSALARPGLYPSPFRRAGSTATAAAAPDDLAIRIHGAPPTLDGLPVDAGPYLDDLVSGFAEMRALLTREAGRLADFVRTLAGVPVRHYHRNTSFYFRLLEASLQPQLLRDGVERELLLEKLWRAYPGPPQPTQPIEEEVEALRRLDIPLFHAAAGGDALVLPGKREVRGWFAGTAVERALERLPPTSPEVARTDARIIRSVFATRAPFPGERRLPGAASGSGPADLSGDWLAVAAGIGDEILAPAIVGGDGSIAWLGLAYHPPNGLWRLERLGADVLSGTGGLALVLSELHRATGEPRFREAAERILARMEPVLAAHAAELSRLPARSPFAASPPLYSGAFYGLGAPIYTLTRCAMLLGRPELDRLAAGFAQALPLEEIVERSPPDLVLGRAGLVLALVGARDPQPPPWRLELARCIALAPEPGADPGPPSCPEGSTYLDCLAGSAAGLALAERRLGRTAAGFPEPRTPGDLLAVLAGSSGAAMAGTLAAVDLATSAPAGSLGSPELLLSLQIALAGARAGAAGLRARAEELAQEMRRRRSVHGAWFFDLAAADCHHLSAVRGLGAVALAMLELHQPGVPLCLAAVE